MTTVPRRRLSGFFIPLLVGACLTAAGLTLAASPAAASEPAKNACAPKAMNPCAAKAMNPCAAKAANPCAAKPMNPCAGAAGAEVDVRQVMRPEGTKLMQATHATLAREGEKLFRDPKLSTNGLSCNSCHDNLDGFMPSFAKPYPHLVAMTKEKAGVTSVALDEMVQFCMVVPMEAKPLPWDSRQLAALAAYTADLQKKFRKAASSNPCAIKRAANPCAAKSMNPCAAKQ